MIFHSYVSLPEGNSHYIPFYSHSTQQLNSIKSHIFHGRSQFLFDNGPFPPVADQGSFRCWRNFSFSCLKMGRFFRMGDRLAASHRLKMDHVRLQDVWRCRNHQFPYGYESIPINTIFRGMNIHLPAILMFTRGTRF